MVYIDLNMVRAGVVKHPEAWNWGGYYEIQNPPARYGVIDQQSLLDITGMISFESFQKTLKEWVDAQLQSSNLKRDATWSSCLAVGSYEYVNNVKQVPGFSAGTGRYRVILKPAYYVSPKLLMDLFFSVKSRF